VTDESDPTTRKLNHLVSGQELYFGLIVFDQLNLAEQALVAIWELVNEAAILQSAITIAGPGTGWGDKANQIDTPVDFWKEPTIQ
jgi:hypothetical protein